MGGAALTKVQEYLVTEQKLSPDDALDVARKMLTEARLGVSYKR